jgi:MFS family permease
MRFDSNRAWTEATDIVKANRDVLWAVAGVFLVLPVFAITLLIPPPEPPAGAEPEALMDLMGAYYTQAAPWFLGMAAFQLIGTLTVLALFTDRTRPTVAEALQLGMKGLLPTILAQILAGMGFFLAAMVVIVPASLAGPAFTVVAVLFVMVGFAYGVTRISMVPPVIMVEGQRNSLIALARSWQLTAANAWRLLFFYALLFVAFWIAILIVGGLIGLGLQLVLGDRIGTPLSAFVSSALQGVMSVYFIAVYAAVHRQLAGPSTDVTSSTFE